MEKLPYTLRAVDPSEIAIGTLNPRTINEKSPDFQELLASVKAVGVQTPICVRLLGDTYQLLAGERRLRAARLAKLPRVPVLDYGDISDELAFEVAFNENFSRADLTPLEAGRAVAMLLDRYKDDVAAVAAKVGQTKHWVQTHAQIDRGLVEVWKKTATKEDFADWTAAHWVNIARLPAAQQEKLHKNLTGSYHAIDRMTADDLAIQADGDKRLLSKAPFPIEACVAECDTRTGYCPLLWGDVSEERPAEDRCLDPKCWDRKAARHAKKQFAELAESKAVSVGYKEVVPLSNLVEPDAFRDWKRHQSWKAETSNLKKIHGKKLVTADDVEIVKKDTAGAVPAIVVAGRGKGAVKWVKPKPAEQKAQSSKAGPDKWEIEKARNQEIARLAFARIHEALSKAGDVEALGALASVGFSWVHREVKVPPAASAKTEDLLAYLLDGIRAEVLAYVQQKAKAAYGYEAHDIGPACAFLDVDLAAIRKQVLADERAAAKASKKKPSKKKVSKKTAKKKTAKKKTAKKKTAKKGVS